MGVIRTILLVVFVIVCILAILLVMIQNESSNGMGSTFGGQTAAFGSHSASVVTKTTGVLVGLFFVIVFTFALLSKDAVSGKGLSEAAAEVQGTTAAESTETGSSWVMEEAAAEAE